MQHRMRRKEKEITDRKEIETIIKKADICRMAMVDEGQPYVVPLNFGYQDNAFYFHSAQKGRKIDVLNKNNHVCIELEGPYKLISADEGCDWGTSFQSIIAFGRAAFITETAAKRKALNIIMAHYSDGSFTYSDNNIKATAIIKVDVDTITGKQC